MKTIVHLSDLHFGRVDDTVANALLRDVAGLAPDLICISGDLTQRARSWQFRRARAFLNSLPEPQLVVPGNHDVPLFNVAARFFSPLGGYTRHITSNLEPVHADSEVVAVGINTTKSLTIKGGHVLDHELDRVCRHLSDAPHAMVRIVVAHHPFETADNVSPGRFQTQGRGAVEELTRCGADVFLTGHLHVSYAGASAARYRIGGRSAIVVEAGTATSTRMRGEVNAFNVLRVEREAIVVERLEWSTSGAFTVMEAHTFTRSDDGWMQRAG